MNERIRDLLAQISSLEDELRGALHEREARVAFTIQGKRIEFERSVQESHQRLKTSFFRWLVADRPLNLLTGPVIYGMALPLLMLDLCVSIYQRSCFPIYGIGRVQRDDYFV